MSIKNTRDLLIQQFTEDDILWQFGRRDNVNQDFEDSSYPQNENDNIITIMSSDGYNRICFTFTEDLQKIIFIEVF